MIREKPLLHTRRNQKLATEFNPAVNQPDAAGQPIDSSSSLIRRRRIRAFVLVVVCAGGLWFLMPDFSPPPSVVILPSDYSIPAPPLPLPDRWIPLKSGWLWKLRYALLGKPAVVNIDSEIFQFSGPGERMLSGVFHTNAPLTSSNGVRAWVLPEKELKRMHARLELEADSNRSAGRMTLGQGVLATMSMTTSPQIAGLSVTAGNIMTIAMRKRGDSIELTGSFTSTEVVTNAGFRAPDPQETLTLHTNLTLAARMQIPRGHGVFLYDTNRADIHSSGVGLLILPKLQ